MKPIVPKYTREQDGRCKLSDKDIKRIKILAESGMQKKKIAKMFKVARSTIYIYISKNYREQWLKYGREKKRSPKQILYNRKAWKKKMKFCGKQLIKYHTYMTKKLREMRKNR